MSTKLVNQSKKTPSRDELLVIAKTKIAKLTQEEILIRQIKKPSKSQVNKLSELSPRLEVWEYFCDMVRLGSFDLDMMKHWANISAEKVKNKKIPKVQQQWLDEKAEVWSDISKILE